MSWLITLSTKDFKEILKRAKTLKTLGKKNIENERVELMFNGQSLSMVVVSSIYTIDANGQGGGIAVLPLKTFQLFRQAFLKAPVRQKELSISYDHESNSLTIGSTRLHTSNIT